MKTVLRKAMTLLLCLCLLLSSDPAAFAEIRNDAAAPEEATANMYFSEQPEVSGVSAENDAPDEAEADGEAAPPLSEPNLKTGGTDSGFNTWGNLTWTLDALGTLTISGSGPMDDFSSDISPSAWRDHLDSITSVIINGFVTRIGNYAFYGCSNLTRVTYSSSVTSIGDYAFCGCSSLTSVTISDSVTSIGDYAFCRCSSLTSVTIGNSVTSIGFRVFQSCTSLTSVTIGNSVTSIGSQAFESCTSLTSVTIGNSVTSIGSLAFNECSGLTDVTIPESVTSIGMGAFDNCSGLKSVTIGNNVTSIGEYAFADCSSLKSVMIPESVTSIGDYAFFGCTGLMRVTILGSMTKSDNSIFKGCTNLTSITFGNNVTGIGDNAFRGCSSLKSVTIGNSVTDINSFAFFGCTSLKSVTIPVSLTRVGAVAFGECSKLEAVYYRGDASQWGKIYIDDSRDDNWNTNHDLVAAARYYNCTGLITNTGDNPWTIILDRPIENCIFETESVEYNPKLAYYLAGLARAVYTESDIEGAVRSLGFDYPNAKTMFLNDPEHSCSGYVIARKAFQENGEDKTLVLIVIRGSVGHDWNNLLNIGDSWTGTGQYPALKKDAETVHNALKELFDGTIPNDSDTYYVITGHSQGAGAANLLGTMLWYDEQVPTSNIYDYTFACPNVACFESDSHWNPGGQYDFIFNIENVEDLVPIVPSHCIMQILINLGVLQGHVDMSTKWGKYGRDRWFIPGEGNRAAVGHDMLFYVRAMSNEYPFSYFYSKAQIKDHMPWDWRVIAGCCPVDMIVYDSTGTPVASVIDNQVCYYGAQSGEIPIVQIDDKKLFFLPNNQEYSVKVIATDSGEMSYHTFDLDMIEEEVVNEKTISSVALDPGKTMVSFVGGDIASSDTRLYVVDENDVPILEVQEDGTEVPITVDPTLGVPVDAGHFPDARFRAYIRANFDRDDPKNGYLSAEEIAQVSSIDVHGTEIKSLAGIKYFTSLKYLYCGDNLLTTLDLSGCTDLKKLYCGDNQLTKLGVGDCSALEVLDCSGNGLTELDLSGCGKVDCLRCAGNSLTILDIGNCPSLLDLFQNGARRETDGVVSHWYDDGMYYIDHSPGLSYDAGVEIWTKAYPKPDCVTPAYLSRIEEEAYAGCDFRCVELNEALTYIGPRAFADCPNLTCIYIPAPTIRIDPEAFGTRTALTVFGPPNGDAEVFAQDHGLAFVAVPQAGMS